MKKKGILLISVLIVMTIALVLFFFSLKDKKTEKISKKEVNEEIIKLNGEEVNFKKYRINQQFYLEIPELFVQMSDEEVNKRYTNDFKPGLIFTDDEMLVNILVHASNEALTNDGLQTFLESYKTTVAGASITKEEITVKDSKNIARLDYTIQNDITLEAHHILFFSIEDKAMMIDFKYPSEKATVWDKICEYTLKSLKFV